MATSIGSNLEYEYSLITSTLMILIFPLAGLFKGIHVQNELIGRYINKGWIYCLWLLFIGPILGIMPGFISFQLNICPCYPGEFYFWMVIQWFPSWLIANAALKIIIELKNKNITSTKIVTAFALCTLFLMLHLILVIWLEPQKRITHLLVGFLHGPIYDNWIPVDGGIILSRVAHCLIAITILLMIRGYKKTLQKMQISVSIALYIACVITSMQYPSTHNFKESLNKLLPWAIKGEGFQIYYQDNNYQTNSEVPTSVKRLFRDTLFHINELKETLGDDLPFVEIYVYPDRNSKKIWFGGGSTDITDVYTPSIHLTGNRWPHPTLRHELVHALSSDFGFHGLGFHPNMAFTEGLAVALAPQERKLTLHESAGSLFYKKRFPTLNNLFSIMFWKESGRRAYAVAGSVIQHLIANHGFSKVKELYAGGRWEDVYQEKQLPMLNIWKKMVKEQYDEQYHGIEAEYLFRYPGVWRDKCPHTKAVLRRPKKESSFISFRQPQEWNPRKDYWQWRVKQDELNLQNRLNYWNQEIKYISRLKNRPKSRSEFLLRSLNTSRKWPPQSIEDIELAILESDFLRLLGERKNSIALLNRLKKFSKEKGIGDSLVRKIEARILVENVGRSKNRLSWRRYLAGWSSKTPDKVKGKEAWIFHYLRLRRGHKELYKNNYLNLIARISPPSQVAATFKSEWYKYLGHRFMEVEKYRKAASSYKMAADVAKSGKKDIYHQYSRKALFYDSYGSITKDHQQNSL